MNRPEEGTSQIHSALYVDFDNIYINFAQQDGRTAHQFATNPERWLSWLEKQMTNKYLGPLAGPRRILIRRCYLNPQTFSEFRPYFIRAAFEVIDCPPLTKQGKTSADIHMVIDILDALYHTSNFIEFIILSADADFSPALVRLRRFSRFTAILPAGFVSPAYKASADYVIPLDLFVREALGVNHADEEQNLQVPDKEEVQASEELLAQMAQRLYDEAIVPGGVEASDMPEIFKSFPEFKKGTHWLGFYSLRRLTEVVVAQRGDLKIVDEDPWRVARTIYPLKRSAAAQDQAVEPAGIFAPDIRVAVAQWIRNIVAESRTAVPMAALAQAVQQRFGEAVSETAWLGAGSFKGLLSQLDLGKVKISTVMPGFVYDPERHADPAAPAGKPVVPLLAAESLDNFSLRYPELALLARKVHQFTETPYLMPEHYALLLQEIAREINENGYHLTRISKTVRDRCVERSVPVGRAQVNFVLIGIGYGGHRLGEELPEDPLKLGEALVQNTLNLCSTAQLNLSEAEIDQIRRWILGGLSPKV
jgi:hypothetical protein